MFSLSAPSATMIGIMNSSTRDNIEFYASREENRIRKQESLEQTNAFTEVKRKPTVTYSEGILSLWESENQNFQGGKLLIDGKLVDEIDGVKLWHEVIKKKAFSRNNQDGEEYPMEEIEEDDSSSKGTV